MVLEVTRKRVKNINFRVKSGILQVSCGHRVSEARLAQALEARLAWAIKAHIKLAKRAEARGEGEHLVDGASVYVWGRPHRLVLEPCAGIKPRVLLGVAQDGSASVRMLGADLQQQDVARVLLECLYRRELKKAMPALFAKWQPVVGKCAEQTRLRKMHTRWGSCNPKDKRIWLSIYLARFPIECSEYVVVHELCHLIEANHSPRFWAQVARAMPDYQRWHDELKYGGMAEG